MSPVGHRSLLRVALLAALGAALALGGCGRKAGLDPPPSAAVSPAPPAEPTLGELSDPNAPGYRRAPREAVVVSPSTQPVPQKRTFILDPLIQ